MASDKTEALLNQMAETMRKEHASMLRWKAASQEHSQLAEEVVRLKVELEQSIIADAKEKAGIREGAAE